MLLATLNRRERAFAPLQTILILAIAIALLLGLLGLMRGKVGAQANGAPSPSRSSAVEPSPLPEREREAARPAAGGADAANERLEQIPDLALLHKMAYLGYSVEKWQKLLRQDAGFFKGIAGNYTVTPNDEDNGLNYSIIKPTDPNDPRVYLSIGGTESCQDILTDVGQLLRGLTAIEAAGNIATGLFPLDHLRMQIASRLRYTLTQIADRQYIGALVIADALARKYGQDNVIILGHSLGGGIANFVSAMLGIRGFGFNAAPLGIRQIQRIEASGANKAGENFTHINAKGEVVSSYPLWGIQVGEIITVEGTHRGFWDFLYNHKLSNILLDRGVRYQPAAGSPSPRGK